MVIASVVDEELEVTTTSEVVVVLPLVRSNTDEDEATAVVVASVVCAVVVSEDVVSATGVVVVVSYAEVVVSALVDATSEVVLDHGAQVSLFCSIKGLAWHQAKEAARIAKDLICILAIVTAVQMLFFSFVLVINNRYRTGSL